MKKSTKAIFSGMIGNTLEFYDFTLYGFFSPIFASLFFPHYSKEAALISSLGIFSVGFIMRPIGGIFFGHMGDRLGRKRALTLSMFLMALSTFMIGILPTFVQIGLIAPFLLVLCRILQGFSAGGEYSGSVVFTIEHSKKENIGFVGALVVTSGALGALLASGMGALVLQPTMPTWGWRIPFIVGSIVGLLGIYIRHKTEESPEFIYNHKKEKSQRLPLIVAFKNHKVAIARTIGIGAFTNVLTNMFVVYLLIHINKVIGVPMDKAMLFNGFALIIYILVAPVMGIISDKFGQDTVLKSVSILTTLLAYPLFFILQMKSMWSIVAAYGTLSFLAAGYASSINAFMSTLFPVNQRYSGIAFGYTIGMAVFGGTTPLVCTFLVNITGNNMAPALYLIMSALIGFVAATHISYFKKIRWLFCKNHLLGRGEKN